MNRRSVLAGLMSAFGVGGSSLVAKAGPTSEPVNPDPNRFIDLGPLKPGLKRDIYASAETLDRDRFWMNFEVIDSTMDSQ